jgi:transcriptional regulator with XRE-family HTH domain
MKGCTKSSFPGKLPGIMAVSRNQTAERIRVYIQKWTTRTGTSQVALAKKAGLTRTWVNSFVTGAYKSIDMDKVSSLATGVGMDVVTFLREAGVAVPLRSDLERVLEAGQVPRDAKVLRLLDLADLLDRRPLLAQLLVLLQSSPDPDVAFVVKAARGIVQAGTIPKLSPTDWPTSGVDECQRCGAVVIWNPAVETFDGLCDDCKREADPSKRISPRVRVTPGSAAASVKPLTPTAKRPREKKK